MPKALRSLRFLAPLIVFFAIDAPAADTATSDSSAPPACPLLGMGLARVSDWSTQSPFLDVFKTAREWIAHKPGEWGGISREAIAKVLDEYGWPRCLPEGATHLSTIILTDLPTAMTSAAGIYQLTYLGKGDIMLNGPRILNRGDRTITFDFTPGPGRIVVIDIRRIDPADPIRNISVVKSSHLAAYRAGKIFNPAWLSKIKDLRLVRFMDWMRTNGSKITRWSERPKPADYTWSTSAGVPLEIMIHLANTIRTDPWFTLPHLADAEYIKNFVTQVRDQLDPELKAWFEYSNEVWNWQFEQARWANRQGRKLWPDLGTAWVQYYAGRAVDMARCVDAVYGSQAESRTVKVISTQTGWLGLEDAILTAPEWRRSHPGAKEPATYFDAYAITGYFDGSLGRNQKPTVVKEWLARSLAKAQADADAQGLDEGHRAAYINTHKYDAAIALAERELRDGSVTGSPGGSLADLFQMFSYHRKQADRFGLQLVMYEGGTHVVGVGSWVEDADLTDFFVHLNYSPAMGRLYDELLSGWKRSGGTLFNAFVDIALPGKHGSWGTLRHIDDHTPRWDSLMRFNRTHPCWWEKRPAGTFLKSSQLRLWFAPLSTCSWLVCARGGASCGADLDPSASALRALDARFQ